MDTRCYLADNFETPKAILYPSTYTILFSLRRYSIVMATKNGPHLNRKISKEVHYTVNGVERVRSCPEHINQPGTDLQKAHWGSFTDIVRLSSHMTDALKIGLDYPARRRHTQPYLHFRSINKDCFTPDGAIDYPHVILSAGTVAQVGVISVKTRTIKKTNSKKITITFDPCLQCGNANPNDELYLYAYFPACCAGILSDPVPRIAGTHTITLPADWFPPAPVTRTIRQSHLHAIGVHLYAFLRCPGPTKHTPEDARASAKNRRGQTSPTIYIPLP